MAAANYLQKLLRKNEKGVAIYLALIVLSLMLAIVLGLNMILIGQIKTVRGMENSALAFSAADAGIEAALYEIKINGAAGYLDGAGALGNGASYEVSKLGPGEGGCPSAVNNYCLKSIGSYKQTRRAIQVSR